MMKNFANCYPDRIIYYKETKGRFFKLEYCLGCAKWKRISWDEYESAVFEHYNL